MKLNRKNANKTICFLSYFICALFLMWFVEYYLKITQSPYLMLAGYWIFCFSIKLEELTLKLLNKKNET